MEYTEPSRPGGEQFGPAGAAVDPSLTKATTPAATAPTIPDYLRETYRWAYLDARNARFLDHESVVRTILWHQHERLEHAAFAEIEPGQRVLQSACVYGNFSRALAEHIGPEGRLDIVDVAAVQVRNAQRKLTPLRHVTVRHENVLHVQDRDLDVACCYFLLHELPGDYKRGVTRALLDTVRPGGKLVFVDYHRPHWAHPLRPITSLVFGLLEPFAKELWHVEIADLAGHDDRFVWRKETFFGGLYQKVVAERRPNS
jgi:ubiquinone/menaquinone biosynthesis C-methylase UbiE